MADNTVRFVGDLERSPSCWTCVHKHNDGPTCTAYPNGIPDAILTGEERHIEPFPGDNGIQYEQIDLDTRASAVDDREVKAQSYKPNSGMVAEAKRGLAWRREHGRGGTSVGIARARDISNGRNLSENTVRRMYSFFSRHQGNKEAEGFRPGEEGYPSNGRIAWALWGGDAGFTWSRNIVRRLNRDDE